VDDSSFGKKSMGHQWHLGWFSLIILDGACDGGVNAKGVVVDTRGQPIGGARLTVRGETFQADRSGCFEIFEITACRSHTLSVAALTPDVAVVANPPSGALGPCERRR
jgi:hypothetical protein